MGDKMPYYPNTESKINVFCVQTARAIRHYLDHRPHCRGLFTARDLAEAGILIPQTRFRILRERGWIARKEGLSSTPYRTWRLTGDALRWLNANRVA